MARLFVLRGLDVGLDEERLDGQRARGDPDLDRCAARAGLALVDSILPVAPRYAVAAEKQMAYAGRIAEMLARSRAS